VVRVNGKEALIRWVNKEADFAELQLTQDDPSLIPMYISCAVPKIDQVVITEGFPQVAGYVKARGYLTGSARKLGPWPNGMVLDLQISPGSSGSMVYTLSNKVIGLVVGLTQAGTGFGVMSPTYMEPHLCPRDPHDVIPMKIN
jgi:hypothetical protein